MTEIIATCALVMIGFAFGASAVSPTGFLPASRPTLWGCLVWGLGLSLGGPTGYAMNPARDFGPARGSCRPADLGKGGSDWGYALVPILGPLIGGAIAAFAIHSIKY